MEGGDSVSYCSVADLFPARSSAPPWIPVGTKQPLIPKGWSYSDPPLEDDSWLDKEIEQEDNPLMKQIMIQVKGSMRTFSNARKREYISDERKRIDESKQYSNDLNTTQGFDVGVYPCLARKICGTFITRYYYPPDITITDFELDKLTRFARMAFDQYLSTSMAFDQYLPKQYPYTGDVLVIKSMRSFSYGICYYLTFQVSCLEGPPEVFEAKVFDEPQQTLAMIEFVRSTT